MKTIRLEVVFYFFLLILLTFTNKLFSQTNPGANCVSAVTLTVNATCSANTFLVSTESGDPIATCGNLDVKSDGYFKFVATTTTTYIDWTYNKPMAVEVYSSCGGAVVTCDASGSVTFPTSIGNTYYVRPIHDSGGGEGTGTICIYEPPVCNAPLGLSSSNETSNSADLSWSANGETTWDIEISTGAFTGTPTVDNTTNNPYTLTGLTASTTYNYQVRSDCGGYTSAWIDGGTFTTTVASYCSSSYSNTTDDWITNVTFNSINNNSVQDGLDSYGDYTSTQSTMVTQGDNYTLSVTFSSGTYDQWVTVWFDWNADGDFYDTGEKYDIGTGVSTTITQVITIPATATVGTTRMRIIERWYEYETDPCNTSYDFGEAEDYTINIIASGPMTYLSSVVTQNNINGTGVGFSDQEIICITVETEGSLSAISLTQFIVNMGIGGGTSDINDITNIHIYYTGAISTFATTNEFVGGGITPASGDITVNGSQALVAGMNYFWVVYDISATAIINNYVDAQCSQITVDGSPESPSTPSPDGEREIIEITTCDHTITLYDFENTGWGSSSVDIIVDGITVLDDLTLASGDNGIKHTFAAEQFSTIETVVNNGNTDMKYIISGFNGDFVLEDGNNKTTPTGKTGVGSCIYEHKFTLNGDTYFNGGSAAKSNSSGDHITLTSDIKGQSSSAWYNYKIDLNQDFEIDFTVNFGLRNGISGADGIAFVLQDECINCGGVGSSIGYGGIEPSVGIEFDTYYNSGNNDHAPSGEWDHTAIFRDGSNLHSGADELTSAVGLAQDAFSNTGMTDGNDYPVKVRWTSTSNLLEMYWDGSATATISYSGDIVTDIFSGNNQVYWGFTSGTGGATNMHKVTITGYPNVSTTTQLQDVTIATGDSYQTEAQQNAHSYNWTPNDGFINNTTIYNPIFTPIVTTTYFCDIEDDCGNIVTDKFTITVGVLPIELLTFYGDCKEGVAELIWATASEVNNDYFVIQRSVDANQWVDVEKIQGAGNSNSVINYEYIDYNQNDGLNYYRLKQVDYNGKFELLETIILNCNSKINSVVFYPNPALGYLNISFKTSAECRLDVVMVNSLGQQVWNASYDVDKGESIINTDVSILIEGVYLVKVITNDGDIVHTDRLIINKD